MAARQQERQAPEAARWGRGWSVLVLRAAQAFAQQEQTHVYNRLSIWVQGAKLKYDLHRGIEVIATETEASKLHTDLLEAGTKVGGKNNRLVGLVLRGAVRRRRRPGRRRGRDGLGGKSNRRLGRYLLDDTGRHGRGSDLNYRFLDGFRLWLDRSGLFGGRDRLHLLRGTSLIVPCGNFDGSRVFPAGGSCGWLDSLRRRRGLGLCGGRRRGSGDRDGGRERDGSRRRSWLLLFARVTKFRHEEGKSRQETYRAICAQESLEVAGVLATLAAAAGACTCTGGAAGALTGALGV